MSTLPIDKGLVGHWPLAGDCEDHSGTGLNVINHGVALDARSRDGRPGTAATFNGADAFLEVQDHPALKSGTGDFAVAAWVHTDAKRADLVGDLVSKFDPVSRKGWQLSVVTNAGMTSTAQSNRRNLQFGIDNDKLDPEWTDCGRPGNAVLIAALKVSGGALYAGTFEAGADEKGHLWRYAGGSEWVDLGNPLGSNVVHSIAEFDGSLYCGIGRYKADGSALGETHNKTAGGKVYQIGSGGEWIDCGHPGAEDATPEEISTAANDSGKADDVMALTVYQGDLYCVSNHRRGVFKYEGGKDWRYIGPDLRIITLAIYRGKLYALINGGPVYRYEGGTEWACCGQPETSRQTYSAVIHQGRFYVGTWPEGEVYVYEGGDSWERVARLGYEREIMGMALYNGNVYLGALPMASVYRFNGQSFRFLTILDSSKVILRRVWTMAVHGGRLFAGTLPSGHVHSVEAGKVATWDETFPGGWHHVAAVKSGGTLSVSIDGQPVAASTEFAPGDFDLDNEQPLRIGFGTHDHLNGQLSDVRLYGRALHGEEIEQLADG